MGRSWDAFADCNIVSTLGKPALISLAEIYEVHITLASCLGDICRRVEGVSTTSSVAACLKKLQTSSLEACDQGVSFTVPKCIVNVDCLT